jgi:hypothetical protein
MLVPINIERNKTAALAQAFGCSVGSLPFSYLGLPLGLTKPKVVDFLPMETRCERRLSSTSAFYLKLADWKSLTLFLHPFPYSL